MRPIGAPERDFVGTAWRRCNIPSDREHVSIFRGVVAHSRPPAVWQIHINRNLC